MAQKKGGQERGQGLRKRLTVKDSEERESDEGEENGSPGLTRGAKGPKRIVVSLESSQIKSLEGGLKSLSSRMDGLLAKDSSDQAWQEKLLKSEERSERRFMELLGVFSKVQGLLESSNSFQQATSGASLRDGRENLLVTSAVGSVQLPSIVPKPSGRSEGKEKRSAYINVVQAFNKEVDRLEESNTQDAE